MDAATALPFSSWMSAMTTARAPCWAKRRAVASPIPLAPPVTMATFPFSFCVTSAIFGGLTKQHHKFDTSASSWPIIAGIYIKRHKRCTKTLGRKAAGLQKQGAYRVSAMADYTFQYQAAYCF
ncbi:hypothetical protein H5410_018072 [Solanum commersonii]|uniref:Uncharacterized protein n=1 Tax=Solanum commersonii TaxID=4109 RepID=A0A9J6A1A6_SOLCO|nr:hypothetical protein H5410_018072 [Solanum commersonii]